MIAIAYADGLLVCNLEHRRRVVALCMFYKIHCNPNQDLEAALPRVRFPARLTRFDVSVHPRYLDVPRSRTKQFNMKFVLTCAQYWNSCDEPYFADNHTNKCVKTCPSNPKYFGDFFTGSCVYNCTNSQYADELSNR